MKQTAHMALALLMTVVVFAAAAQATVLKTVADAEVGERPGQDRGSNGTELNIRTFLTGNADRNELIVMRFDLSSVDLNNYTAATLNLTHHRDNGSERPYKLYGVNDGATGGDNNGSTPGYSDNDWDEGSVVMSTMPGLTFDGDASTQGVNAADTTDLGGGSLSDALKGDVEVIDVAGLFPFLTSHPDDLVTLILARDLDLEPGSTGQDRFASKEATELDGGSPTGVAGDFAPFLELTPIPEPASISLVALCGMTLAAVRRRKTSL